jgi:hypothetical protein
MAAQKAAYRFARLLKLTSAPIDPSAQNSAEKRADDDPGDFRILEARKIYESNEKKSKDRHEHGKRV